MTTMDQFKASIADMDDEESASHSGQHGKKAPFAMWKSIYSLCFLIMAVTQLSEVWM